MRILVAESDTSFGTLLQRSFEAEKYVVDLVSDGEQAESLALRRLYDVAILDLNVAHPGAVDVLQHIRATRPNLPIVILTNQTRSQDRVRVLDLGADDLVRKPFVFSELSAHVRALLRRGRSPQSVLRIEDLELDRVEHRVKRAERTIDLTPKEFALLEYLMRNAGQPMTRTQIIEDVWNLSFDTMTNVVDVYINYLRKKVDSSSDRKLIHTVRGLGYQLQGNEGPGKRAFPLNGAPSRAS